MRFFSEIFYNDRKRYIVYRFSGLFYSDHSKYREYRDAHMYREMDHINAKVDGYNRELNAIKSQINANFENAKKHYEENINRLKSEKNYPALNNASPENLVEAVKADMRREIEDSISRDKQELAEIDKMISRINEIEQQAKRA